MSQLPDRGFAHATLGFALLAQGDAEAAEASLRQAVALPADGPEQLCGNGMIQLLLGELKPGFAGFEARWLRPRMAANPIRTAGPAWTGAEKISGRTVLLYCEQGLGDTVQFLRFVPAVLALGARVKLAVQPEITPLLPAMDGVTLCRLDQGVPEFDLHCPLVSLPAALGITLDELGATASPYLRAPAERAAAWAARLAPPPAPRSGLFARKAPAPPLRRIGLAWSGNPGHANDRNRSLALRQLAPLLAVPGCQFHVVQKDVRDADLAALMAATAATPKLVDPRGLIGDLADTAAIMAQMDLVISADTAAAHLAGSLGRPLWLLLPAVPDWRWLLHREDSPWYPTARLFRQRVAGDWEEVIARVAAALAAPPGG